MRKLLLASSLLAWFRFHYSKLVDWFGFQIFALVLLSWQTFDSARLPSYYESSLIPCVLVVGDTLRFWPTFYSVKLKWFPCFTYMAQSSLELTPYSFGFGYSCYLPLALSFCDPVLWWLRENGGFPTIPSAMSIPTSMMNNSLLVHRKVNYKDKMRTARSCMKLVIPLSALLGCYRLWRGIFFLIPITTTTPTSMIITLLGSEIVVLLIMKILCPLFSVIICMMNTTVSKLSESISLFPFHYGTVTDKSLDPYWFYVWWLLSRSYTNCILNIYTAFPGYVLVVGV